MTSSKISTGFLPGIFAILTWTTPILQAQPATVRPIHEIGDMLLQDAPSLELLRSGRTSVLRFRLAEAERTFRKLARSDNGKAPARYHLAAISLLKLLTGDRDEHEAEFLARSDSLRAVVDKLPETRWRGFFAAEASLQRAFGRAKRGSYIRAAFAGKSAYGHYKRLVEDYPDFYEARKGLGLMQVAIGSLPGFYRTFLRIIGLRGALDEGLVNIGLAADSSRYARDEAQVFLSLFGLLTAQEDGPWAGRLGQLYERYPDSPLWAHLYGFELYTRRRATAAEAVLRPAAQRIDDPEYFYVDYIDFFLADALFRQDRFQEAIPLYQRYLDRHSGPALKALASLQMGTALEMIGHRRAAVSFYEDVDAKREFDSDHFARRRARKLIDAPMTDAERRLLRGRNAFDAGRYNVAATILDSVASDNALPTALRAEAAYRLGRTLHVQGALSEAIAAYAVSAAMPRESGSRWAPWSEYYRGRAYEDLGDREAARNAYERAGRFKGSYDYHQSLEKNVKVARARLEAVSSP